VLLHVLVQFGQRVGRPVRVPVAGATSVRPRGWCRSPDLVRAQRRHSVRQTAGRPPFARQEDRRTAARAHAAATATAAVPTSGGRQELRHTVMLNRNSNVRSPILTVRCVNNDRNLIIIITLFYHCNYVVPDWSNRVTVAWGISPQSFR
jgi:hypothetical protein